MNRLSRMILLGGVVLWIFSDTFLVSAQNSFQNNFQNGAASGTQALPAGESILEHYVEATGGKAAYQKHNSETIMGTIAFPEQGLSGRLTRYAMLPDKEYSVVELGPIGKIESGFSNGIAWEKSAILGPRIKTGVEREQAQREAHFNASLEWRNVYSKIETVGVETAEGEECYKVILTPKSGKPETQYFSKKTGLLLKTTTSAVSPMGEVNVEVIVSDYKNFGGILYPAHSTQKAGEQKLDITITSVVFNEPIPAEYFEPPAEIKALMPKVSGAKAGGK